MTTIPAARLRTMLAQVKPHMSKDAVLPAIGVVHVERRGGWLYTVATDRYTVAVARTAVEGDEEWQSRIPAADLRTVEVWLKPTAGDIEVTADEAGITLAADTGSSLRVNSDSSEYGTFIGWRKLLRTMLAEAPTEVPSMTGFNTAFLARWKAAETVLHASQAGPRRPLVLTDDEGLFVGMQMPTTPGESLTREGQAAKWLDDIADPPTAAETVVAAA